MNTAATSEVPGVHSIRIPLPGYPDLETANAYLITLPPVTLIDTTPKFPGSLEFVRQGIHEAGFRIRDLERILLTHSHIDHFGLVARLREEAGGPVPCYIHAEECSRIAETTYRREMFETDAETLMAMVGMPDAEALKIRERFSLFDLLCDPVPDALPMEDGDIFEGDGYALRVVHTPGHTPGSCCFHEMTRRVLFSGDHLLQKITPNPLFELRKDLLRDSGYLSLKAFLQSLNTVSLLAVDRVFPGHGEPFGQMPEIISGYRKHHQERANRLWQALNRGSRPLYDLIQEVFDAVPEGDTFLAISEILVHLELLIDQGRAVRISAGPPALYAAMGYSG